MINYLTEADTSLRLSLHPSLIDTQSLERQISFINSRQDKMTESFWLALQQNFGLCYLEGKKARNEKTALELRAQSLWHLRGKRQWRATASSPIAKDLEIRPRILFTAIVLQLPGLTDSACEIGVHNSMGNPAKAKKEIECLCSRWIGKLLDHLIQAVVICVNPPSLSAPHKSVNVSPSLSFKSKAMFREAGGSTCMRRGRMNPDMEHE